MAAINYIRLSELTGNIARVINANFSARTFWVIAEITNLKHYPQKNYYFLDLVEKDPVNNTILTSIKANAWSTATARIRNFEQLTGQKFDNNIRLLLQVSVEYHISFGLKLNIHDVDPSFTMGNLEKQKQLTLQQLIAKNPGFVELTEEGYITFNKTLPLSPVIQKIALIASPGSDGYNDFKHELDNNLYGYAFTVDEYPAQVQGAGMETGIVKKLIEIFISQKLYDAVVIVRGGGSQTDFLIFDSYEMGKAIARFPVPVFTGIGHTRNESIADMMAFRATKTPTKVAESIISHNRLFEEKVMALQKSIVANANEMLSKHLLSLSNAKSVISSKSRDILHLQTQYLANTRSFIKEYAAVQLNDQRQLLEKQFYNIKHNADKLLTASGYKLQQHIQLIKLLSPDHVLKRGYALIYQNGKLITSGKNINKGSELTTVMADSIFKSVVSEINKKNNE